MTQKTINYAITEVKTIFTEQVLILFVQVLQQSTERHAKGGLLQRQKAKALTPTCASSQSSQHLHCLHTPNRSPEETVDIKIKAQVN